MRWPWAAVLIGLMWPVSVQAQAVRVSSGDHGDFTRVVVEFPGPVDWKVGRTADGYELRLPEAGTQYDLSGVFDLIGKDRLAAIWADPVSGALHFGIACACFAMPFEFRPGTIVIDIRNGPPPEGSSFEEALEGGLAPELVDKPVARPAERSQMAGPKQVYDWTEALNAGRTAPRNTAFSLDVSTPEEVRLDLEPLRRSLMEQLSRGATDGVVDMAKPRFSVEPDEDSGNPSVNLHQGEVPNLVIRQKGAPSEPLSAAGAACIADERLNVADWSEEAGFSQQFGPALEGLTGEFDRPEPEAVRRAVRFYLSIGFGAEARGILRAFPTEQEDEAIWQSMARILDGEPDPAPAFQGMAACDTAAALWAILADPAVLSVGQVEKAAILRAFSALPIHLRQQIGPTMVDRFLAMKDFVTATALRDAVLRGTFAPGPEVELMEAAIEKASGAPVASAERLEELAAQSGPTTPDALAALVVQRAELGLDVSFEQVTAMEEYAKEREDSEDRDKFDFALTLGYAASGDFDKAFDKLADVPDAGPVVWQLLAAAGPDSALLAHAVLGRDEAPSQSAHGAASLIAQRLVTLGLAEQAARWMSLATEPPALLSAKVALGQGDAEGALGLVAGETTPAADDIRISAYRLLGDEASIAALHAAREEPEESWAAVSRMRDWERLATDGPEVWKVAATHLLGPPSVEGQAAEADLSGPMERDRRLIDESVSTRAAISALLDTVSSPGLATQ